MNIRNPFTAQENFPELTSLIDVMFLLLIFFMLTTTFVDRIERKRVPVELPTAMQSRIITKEHATVITVAGDGALAVDSRPCDPEALAEVLKIRVAQSADSTILISAHREAPFHAIVFIYDVIQGCGLRYFAHEVQ
jgi:biopolymer transport protein ExbD